MRIKSFKWILIYGFLIWMIPFLVSFPIFYLKETYPPLFETIMAVTLSLVIMFFSVLHFRKIEKEFMLEGLKAGIIWFLMSILIDLPLFLEGPMKMPIPEYMMDIGLTYLMIPVMTVGIGYLLEKRK